MVRRSNKRRNYYELFHYPEGDLTVVSNLRPERGEDKFYALDFESRNFLPGGQTPENAEKAIFYPDKNEVMLIRRGKPMTYCMIRIGRHILETEPIPDFVRLGIEDLLDRIEEKQAQARK